MENTDSEHSLSDEIKPKQWNPNPKGRVKSAFWRYKEDGTYNNNPISESYYRDYCHEKLSMKKECEFCKSSVYSTDKATSEKRKMFKSSKQKHI
jgi:hypothetical protein